MPQLGRFDETYSDPATGRPRRNASVTLYREGATVNGNQSGTSPLTLTVRHRGKIAAADSVFIGIATGTTYTVDSVTATTVVLSGFVGTLNVSNGDRITPSNSQPTLYSDDQGGATTANPLTASATGRASCWLTPSVYDVVVSGSGVTTTAFISQVTSVIYDGQLGTLFLRDAAEGGFGDVDPTLYSDVTRDMSLMASGAARVSLDIVSRFINTTALTNVSLISAKIMSRFGASGSGGGSGYNPICLGSYFEYRGGDPITATAFGTESAATLYNTGTLTGMTGLLGMAQVSTGTGTITNMRGIQGIARHVDTGAGTVTDARGVEGHSGLEGTSSGNITTATGGYFFIQKDGGVSGTITTAYGVQIVNVTQGGTNNFGLRIGGASGGSNTNQSLRVDSGESHFIGPLTSPVVAFSSADATPSVSGSNVFKTANAGATTITMFDDGKTGQRIWVIIGDMNTTIDFTGTNLKGNVGADWVPTTNDSMECLFDGVNWYCRISDNTV